MIDGAISTWVTAPTAISPSAIVNVEKLRDPNGLADIASVRLESKTRSSEQSNSDQRKQRFHQDGSPYASTRPIAVAEECPRGSELRMNRSCKHDHDFKERMIVTTRTKPFNTLISATAPQFGRKT